MPWIIKYRPKHIDEVVDQDNAKEKVLEWLNLWGQGVPKNRALILYGPPGCGKTSLVEAISKTYGYELFEMNASDNRRRGDIERLAKMASQTSGLSGKKRLILLDEVDGLDPRADAGGIEALWDVIRNTRNPVIMTANNPYREHLRPLREVSEIVAMDRLKEKHVLLILNKICTAENLKCDKEALDEIARRSEGDIRSAINDLEAVSALNKLVTLDTVKAITTYRDRIYAPWDALRKLFTAKYLFQAKNAITSSDLSPDEIITWVNEHIPSYYESDIEVWRAYEALSRADVYLGRIIKTQNWDLLSFVTDLMGPGVAFARTTYKYRWVAFKMPERIRLLIETKKSRELRETIATYLASRLQMSRASFKSEVLPYLRVIFTSNPRYAARIARSYGLPEELVTWISGPKAREVISYMKKHES